MRKALKPGVVGGLKILKSDFHEDFESDKLDVLDGQHNDFPWEELYARLDEAKRELSERDYEAMVIALRRILDFILATDLDRKDADALIGRRAIALGWTLSPALFIGSPSLRRLSKSIGVNNRNMSKLTAQASRKFGCRNRAQLHGHNWRENELALVPKHKGRPVRQAAPAITEPNGSTTKESFSGPRQGEGQESGGNSNAGD